MNHKELINFLQDGNKLDKSLSKKVLNDMLSDNIEKTIFSSILCLLNTRPYSVNEVLGFREALLESALIVDLSEFSAIDLVGTGGDGKSSFNISTASSLLLAAAKVPLAKHGNHGVSSLIGSSTILEEMGYKFSNEEDKLKRELDNASICFLHAPLFHPAMKKLSELRKTLGVRTIFNILGPLLNPANIKTQMNGLYSLDIFYLYDELLSNLGHNYLLVHSSDGFDELSLTSSCYISRNGINTFLEPSIFKYENILFPLVEERSLLSPESPKEAAKLMFNFLKGEGNKELEDVIISNASLAYTLKFPEVKLESAIALLRDVLHSGAAYLNTKKLLEMQ